MIGSRAWYALMLRNTIYRKRYWISTLFELLLPILSVCILIAIKNAAQRGDDNLGSQIIGPKFPNASTSTFTYLTFRDYITALQAKRICILNNDTDLTSGYYISGLTDYNNWQIPLILCDSRLCTYNLQNAQEFCQYNIIGIASSNSNTNTNNNNEQQSDTVLEFLNWLEVSYPILSTGNIFPGFNYSIMKRFEDEDDMNSYIKSNDYGTYPNNPKISMGIIFTSSIYDTNIVSYTLRPNATGFNAPQNVGRPATITTPNTKRITNNYAKNDVDTCLPIDGTPFIGYFGFSCTGQYMYNGVLTFQRLIQDFIIDIQTDNTISINEASVQFVPFPVRPYKDAGFYASLEGYGPLIITLGLLYTVATMTSYIVSEKELRQKELMKMMSINENDIGWSWFITYFLFHIITSILVAGVSDVLYDESTFLALWFFWILTFITIIVFCMCIASILSKAIWAVLLGILIFFAGSFIALAVPIDDNTMTLLMILSIHPVTAFSYGLAMIGRLEDNGFGLSSNTMNESLGNLYGYTFNDTIIALLYDCIIWGVLTWYFNRVIKPAYGQALPYYFPFTSSYWFPNRYNNNIVKDDNNDDNDDIPQGIPYEPVSDILRRQKLEGKSIEIYNLCKKFGDDKIAVNQLQLSMYSGQITALLGHNGAGKTTTIGMLTGAIQPTSGYAIMGGNDIRTQMNTIRQDIGICLQHDCLFPMLTVREHIQFFCRIKGLYNSGISKEDVEEQINQSIRDVALYEKRNTYSKSLSGGMKRKLSVAIAFSGGSKIVMLDEPTSGMDPFSRRFTWNVIRQYRQDRCIILTTHFMDEADILGDRIAIMAEGQLRCAGSSLFLKKTYGVGYQLMIEKNQAHSKEQQQQQQQKQLQQEQQEKMETYSEIVPAGNNQNIDDTIRQIIKDAVPEASLLNDTGAELRYQLPMTSSPKFPNMFEGLDEQVDLGTMQSYGVSLTTLDEVFLLVARGDQDKAVLASSRRLVDDNNINGVEGAIETKESRSERSRSIRSRMDLNTETLFFRHLSALFKKRASNFSRDKKAWFCTTLAPTLCVLLGLIFVAIIGSDRQLDPITLSMQDLNEDVTESPINPIQYNHPDTPFLCQPGNCAYQPPIVFSINETNEVYGFCGYLTRPLNLTDPQWLNTNSCSIVLTEGIMDRIEPYANPKVMDNITDVYNSSKTIYKRSDNYEASQYGAILFTHDPNSIITETDRRFNDTIIEQCQSNSAFASYVEPGECSSMYNNGLGYVIQYNFTALHMTPLLQAMADEAIIRQYSNNDQFEIKLTIAPLPITTFEEGLAEADDSLLLFVLVVLSFPIISGSFGSFIVAERESKAKHLQTVAGVYPTAYWLSSFFWDVLNYQIPLWITIAMFFIFDMNALTTNDRGAFSGIATVLFLYGPASASWTYCLTFAFTSPTLCAIVTIISGFLVGMGGPLALFIMTILSVDPTNPNPNLGQVVKILTWCLSFHPSFCMGKSIFYVLNINTFVFVEGNSDLSVWSTPILLWEVIFLCIQSVVYLVFAILLDMNSTNPATMSCWKSIINICCCMCAWGTETPEDTPTPTVVYAPGYDDVIQTNTPVDSDVVTEENRVLSGDANSDLIVISQLTKVYGTGKKAVDSVSLGIPNGQCFGLLGINGAGKTTTMAILTAEFPPSSGDATLAGFSVTKQPEKTRRRIGYCPQFDAHFANMTGREHIELYASIKGVPRDVVKDAVAEKLREVGLNDFDSDRLCSNYSGGMKRRLSLAIATIGNPQILFLDECSTGVDPVARREIWEMISAIVSDETIPLEDRPSIILTTHSMEECEALCPRIAIMANGKLRCLGSAQHLKNKFGQGYQVELRTDIVHTDDSDYTAIVDTLTSFKQSQDSQLEDKTLNLNETIEVLEIVSGDNYLSAMISSEDSLGFNIWRDAQSPSGISLVTLAVFATSEIRMKNLKEFLQHQFPSNVLRERQDLKVRYEVSSKDTKLSDIFQWIEMNKESFWLSDYGVSQTSLEQVFNMHAEEAEKLKQGRDDA